MEKSWLKFLKCDNKGAKISELSQFSTRQFQFWSLSESLLQSQSPSVEQDQKATKWSPPRLRKNISTEALKKLKLQKPCFENCFQQIFSVKFA